MADFVFNIAKGAVAEMVRDGASAVGVILIKTAESDANMKDRATLATVVANSTEADFTDYARKTGITATVTVDNTNDRVDVDIPDQTWTGAGGATNNTLAKLVTYYENSASDANRVPMTAHDFVATTDDTDLVAVVATAGFFRAS